MKIRIITSSPFTDRIFEDVDACEVGPNGELLLTRNYVTFFIVPPGKWDAVALEEIYCYNPPVSGEPTTPGEMLEEFHSVFPRVDDNNLRRKLLAEEVVELIDAMEADDIVEIADALADIVYVTIGTAIVKGIPFDEIFAEVHRSNMTKRGNDGKPVIRDDGKILKGSNFQPPRIREILKKHGMKVDAG